MLFSGSWTVFFVRGCSNLSSLIAFLGLELWFTEARQKTQVSQWVGTLAGMDTCFLPEEDLKEPFNQFPKGRISVNMTLFRLIHS